MRLRSWICALACSFLSSVALAQPKAAGTTWAVVVGIDDYQKESVPDLKFAVADAKLFGRALQDTMKIPVDHIFLMTSDAVDEAAQPRAVNVAYRLGWLKEHLSPEDTVVFYFAGHGVTVDGQPFLLTEEADNRNSLTLKVSAMLGTDLIGSLRSARAANVWVVLDACRDAPGRSQNLRLDGTLTQPFSNADVGLQQTATMFACKVGEKAWEWSDKGHGCYTYYLVEGLQKQAADASGRVTLFGLSEYVNQQVPAQAKRLGASTQNPWMFYGGPGVDRWLLASVTPPTTATRNSGKGATDQYVARLEALQARLDQETALRVMAEDKARLAENRRAELEQRLALMEKSINPAAEKVSLTSAPQLVAYTQRGLDNPAAMQQEIARLKRENEELKSRLGRLEEGARQVGLNSRSVALAEEPELSAEWNQAEAEEQQAENVFRTALAHNQLAEQLDSQANMVKIYDRQVTVLEKLYGTKLSSLNRSAEQRQAMNDMKAVLKVQREAIALGRCRVHSAEMAADEARMRLQEAQMREKVLETKLDETLTELQRVKTELRVAQQDAADLRREAAQREDALKQGMLSLATVKKRTGWGGSFWGLERQPKMMDATNLTPLIEEAQSLPPAPR